MAAVPEPASRRGRLPASDIAARRRVVLDAARAELIERGDEGTSMLGIARRARASKETLYSWFGSREQLLAEIVRDEADDIAARLESQLSKDSSDLTEVLTAFGRGLLALLTGDWSVAVNRAAMTSTDLAAVVLAEGRHRVGPVVERYLARAAERGEIKVRHPGDAFTTLYGLIVRDTQIRVLLGEPPASPRALGAQARQGVEQFLELARAGSAG